MILMDNDGKLNPTDCRGWATTEWLNVCSTRRRSCFTRRGEMFVALDDKRLSPQRGEMFVGNDNAN